MKTIRNQEKQWIPAFAGMTTLEYRDPILDCHSGLDPESGSNASLPALRKVIT
jgi:hypothetical protein